MTTPLLTFVSDQARATMSLPELAREAVAGGVDIVQIREHGLDAYALEALAVAVVQAIGADRVALNDAPALAARLGTSLHLPERAFDGFEFPSGVGTVSGSVHGLTSLSKVPAGLDFVIAGHVFPTSTHPGRTPLGIDGLEALVTASERRVIAIGGITPENAHLAMATGASGVAAISYVNSSSGPGRAARELRDALERAMYSPKTAVSLQVNGKSMSVDPDTTLTSFLESRNLHPRLVVVERNREIVAKSAYDSTVLQEGDLVEIAHFVGGG